MKKSKFRYYKGDQVEFLGIPRIRFTVLTRTKKHKKAHSISLETLIFLPDDSDVTYYQRK